MEKKLPLLKIKRANEIKIGDTISVLAEQEIRTFAQGLRGSGIKKEDNYLKVDEFEFLNPDFNDYDNSEKKKTAIMFYDLTTGNTAFVHKNEPIYCI